MARPTSRAEQKAATRERLLKVARRVFVRHGYDAASIAICCREAKVTHGALYHHFPSKEALFAAVVAEVFAGVAARVNRAVAAQQGWAQVEAACAAYLAACAEPEVQTILFQDGPRVMPRAAFDAIDHAVNAPLVDGLIEAWIRQGLLEPRPVSLLARTLGAAFAEAGLLIREAEGSEHVRAQLYELLLSWISVLRRAPEPKPFPVLPTARLLLRPWTAMDLAALQTLAAQPDVYRYLFDGKPPSRAWLEEATRASSAAFARGAVGLWLAEGDAQQLVGFAGFVRGEGPAHELVVATAPTAQRRGYGFELAKAVIFEARARGCQRIGANADEANVASARLLAKLGFVSVGRGAGRRGSVLEYALPVTTA